MATSSLPSPGSPMPSKGRTSPMAHKWAQWVNHPCLLGAPQCLARGERQKWPTSGQNGWITLAFSRLPNAEQGEKIRNGPQVGRMPTSSLPSRGSPMPRNGRKSEMAHKWAEGLHHPCLLGAPQCLARGGNQKWPTSGHNGYITPADAFPWGAGHGTLRDTRK